MKPELQKQLVDKYPLIFKDYGGDPTVTCMAWGIDVGDGWYDLIDQLCGLLTWFTDPKHTSDPIPQVTATQCKEKYGGLRFYHDGGNRYAEGVVDMAEAMSFKICEDCGNAGKVNESGWLSTLCEGCRDGRRR
jgi:hypothetical protein